MVFLLCHLALNCRLPHKVPVGGPGQSPGLPAGPAVAVGILGGHQVGIQSGLPGIGRQPRRNRCRHYDQGKY